MPNYYVISATSYPRVINSTSSRYLTYVASFTKQPQYKRAAIDTYSPPTPDQRFAANLLYSKPMPVIPTPVKYDMNDTNTVTIHNGGWVVVAIDSTVQHEASLLAGIYKYAFQYCSNLKFRVTLKPSRLVTWPSATAF